MRLVKNRNYQRFVRLKSKNGIPNPTLFCPDAAAQSTDAHREQAAKNQSMENKTGHEAAPYA
ncbi:MAG: hypothetical protein ACYSWZ_21800 [Planctomycetota bacterium]